MATVVISITDIREISWLAKLRLVRLQFTLYYNRAWQYIWHCFACVKQRICSRRTMLVGMVAEESHAYDAVWVAYSQVKEVTCITWARFSMNIKIFLWTGARVFCYCSFARVIYNYMSCLFMEWWDRVVSAEAFGMRCVLVLSASSSPVFLIRFVSHVKTECFWCALEREQNKWTDERCQLRSSRIMRWPLCVISCSNTIGEFLDERAYNKSSIRLTPSACLVSIGFNNGCCVW